MIHDYQELTYKGRVVFNKLTLSPPERQIKEFYENEACFMFVSEGEFSVRTPDALIPFKKGKGMLAKCFNFFIETTKAQRAKDNTMVVIGVYVFPEIVEELLQVDLSQSNHKLDFNLKQVQIDKLLDNFKESIEVLLDTPELADEAIIKTKLKKFLLLISKTEGASQSDFLAGLFKLNAFEFRSTVSNNIYSSLSIDQFAQLCSMSTSSFKRKFNEVYNEPPAKYLVRMKLEKASGLITSSDLRISDIAYDCGFETISTFNRSFKTKFGTSPSDYRLSQIA